MKIAFPALSIPQAEALPTTPPGFCDLPLDVTARILDTSTEGRLSDQARLAQLAALNHHIRKSVLLANGTGHHLADNPVGMLQSRLEKPDCRITRLNLVDANLRPAPLLALVKAASRAASCHQFLLAGNRIDDLQCRAICEHLKHKHPLTELDLRNNDWTSRGLADVCNLVAGHPEIKRLDLSLNRIDAAGFAILVSTLAKLPALSFLGLFHCGIPNNHPGLNSLRNALPDCEIRV